ncbi:MAG TPA: IS1-like element transposase [Saprospiraceae bacterium]|nr:IS1-like element transposase [Saprospiraceae bacterium]
MILIPVKCPTCDGTDVVRYGKQANGEQRYRCNKAACERKIFLLHYDQKDRRPEVKKKILDMAVNGRGIRDTARVLDISPVTVIKELKKQHRPSSRSIQRP